MFRELEINTKDINNNNMLFFNKYISYSQIFENNVNNKSNYNYFDDSNITKHINYNLVNYLKEIIFNDIKRCIVLKEKEHDEIINYFKEKKYFKILNIEKISSDLNYNRFYYSRLNLHKNQIEYKKELTIIRYNFKPYFLFNETLDEIYYSLVIKKEYVEYVLFSYLNEEMIDLDCLEFWIKKDIVTPKFKFHDLKIQKWILKSVIPEIKLTGIKIVEKNNIEKELFHQIEIPNFKNINEKKTYFEKLYENLKK